jgi:hypothetical protein
MGVRRTHMDIKSSCTKVSSKSVKMDSPIRQYSAILEVNHMHREYVTSAFQALMQRPAKLSL